MTNINDNDLYSDLDYLEEEFEFEQSQSKVGATGIRTGAKNKEENINDNPFDQDFAEAFDSDVEDYNPDINVDSSVKTDTFICYEEMDLEEVAKIIEKYDPDAQIHHDVCQISFKATLPEMLEICKKLDIPFDIEEFAEFQNID